MEHHFNCEIAEQYGIAEAIILNHFEYWIKKNKANDKNYFNGNYWTYNSVKAFKEIFPYLTEKKISSALAKLKNEGIIITGNFNENKYDRTLWYAITKKGYCILQNGEMENPKMENPNTEKGEPIPNNKTNIIPNDNKKERKTSYDEIINDKISNKDLKDLIHEFIKMRKLKKKPLTDRALSIQLNKLLKLSSNIEEQKKIVEKSIVRCWDEFYPLNQENNSISSESKENNDYYKLLEEFGF